MTLAKQPIDIPIGKLDTSADPRRTPPGRFVDLKNAIFTKDGALSKRRGYVQMASGGMPASTHSLLALGDRLVAIGATQAFYDSQRDQWQTFQAGEGYPRTRASSRIFPGAAVRAPNFSTAVHLHYAAVNGYEAIAYRAGGESGWFIQHTASGRIIQGNINNGLRVRFTVLGNTLAAWEQASPATSWSVYAFDTSTTLTALPIPTTLAMGVTFDSPDICEDVANNCYWIGHVSTGATSTFRLTRVNTAFSIVATYTQVASDVIPLGTSVFKHPGVNRVYCAWSSNASSGSFQTSSFDINSTTFSTPNTPVTGITHAAMGWCASPSGNNGVVALSCFTNTPLQTKTYVVEYGPAGGAPLGTYTREGFLAGKPFLQGGVAAVPLSVSDYSQIAGAYVFAQLQTVLVDGLSGRILAKADQDTSPHQVEDLAPVRWYSPSANRWRGLTLQILSTQADTSGAVIPVNTFALKILEVDFAPGIVQSVEQDGILHLSGSVPTIYDGASILDACPLTAPYRFRHSPASTGGNIDATSARNYAYRALYAYVDAKGNQHRGPFSLPSLTAFNTGTSTASNTITFNGLPGDLFGSGSNANVLRLELYRTLASGSVYYLARSTVDRLVVIDIISDARLAPSAQLNTAELSPASPPGFDHLARVGQRLWGVHRDRQEAWYSKLPIPGYATEWASENVLSIPSDAGAPVAVAEMDGTPVILTSKGLLRVIGEGPDNTGSGGDYQLVAIPGSVGCVSAASVAVIPDGVLYLTAKGWRLLDRSFQLARRADESFFGAEVDDYKAVTVHSSVNIPDASQVRYIVSGVAGVDVLVYDWERRQWSTFDLAFTPAGASTVWQGRHVLLGSDNRVWVERLANDAALYCDGSSFVPMSLRTGWLNYSGIEGFGRLWRVALAHESKSAHGMSVTIDTEVATQTKTWSEAEIAALPAGRGAISVHVGQNLQKANRHRITITDTAPAVLGTGEGYSLVGLQLEVGVKQGLSKLSRGARK